MRRASLLLTAALLGACNAIFSLEPTETQPSIGTQGEGGSGAAGEAGEAGAGGLAGQAGVAGAAGAASQGGAGGLGSGGQGGVDPCVSPKAFDQIRLCNAQECKGAVLTCENENEPCEFRCIGQQSCETAKFQCPPERDCRVLCEGDRACKDT